MLDGSLSRYNRRINDAKVRSIESTLPYGKRILSSAIPLTSEKIREDIFKSIDEYKTGAGGMAAAFLHDKDYNKLAAIASRCILDMVSSQRTYTSACISIGNMVCDEVLSDNMKVMRKTSFQMWKEVLKRRGFPVTPRRVSTILRKMGKNFELSIKDFGKKEKLAIGAFLINCFREATGLIEVKNLFDRKHRSTLHIVATNETMKWIANFNQWASILEPVYIPMVIKPARWVSGKIYGGGYDIRGTNKEPMIKSKNKKFLNSLDGVEMDEVVDSLNTLQEVPFKINGRVLDVMLNFWNNGQMVGDLVVYKEIPLPQRPNPEVATKEEVRAYYKEVATTHCANDSARSRSLLASKILYVANKFQNEEAIYFPHQVDFRGRAYPMPIFLNPQGNDLAKSLLLFSEGKQIKNKIARDWLLIFGANLWGLDKRPFSERIDWVEKNAGMIHSIANNPYEDRRWTEADSPWLFLAFCFEFSEFANRGYGFTSYLPISVDATNNGIQILSMLMRDPVGAKYTNVIDGDEPQDIYGIVASKTVDRLNTIGTETSIEWADFGITRKAVKRPVMTLPYGSTLYSCRQYIEDWYLDEVRSGKKKLFDISKLNKKTQMLATEVWAAMDGPIGMARAAMVFIQDLASFCSNRGVPFRWISPCGMVCLQEYYCQRSMRVVLNFNGTFRVTPKVNEPTDKIAARRQRNGAAPNVVHSYDSSCLHKSVSLAKQQGVSSFMMIHDSYGTHASDVETLLMCAKRAFVDVFSVDQLSDLREQVKKLTGSDDGLPDVPSFGSLDINELYSSKYFMS